MPTETEEEIKEILGHYGYKELMPIVRAEGLTYSKFINGLTKSKINIDRKVLADIAYNNPETFKSIVKKVQSHLN